MRRHSYFICFMTLFVLIGNQRLHADDRFPSKQRAKSTPRIPYDRFTDQYLPINALTIAPEHIITQWSAASQFLSPLSPSSKVKEFKKGNQAYYSGHELTLISEFQQPVSTQVLLANYDWQVVKQTKTSIILRGQPKDVLTRHLCRPFELQINYQSMLPTSLKFLADASKQKKGFASIELTAFKLAQAPEPVNTKPAPQTVLRKVAKAVFPQEGNRQDSNSIMGPIKRISFATSNSDNKNQAELLEIEKRVLRWIAETQRIESIQLGNGVTIFKPGDHQAVIASKNPKTKLDGTYVSGIFPYQDSLQPWLIDVDKNAFIIDSFITEKTRNDNDPSAPRFITLNIKPNPAYPLNLRQGTKWDAVEIVFSSDQLLPVKISKTRLNFVQQFLLSDLKVQYAE